jgi:pimeloyl-ACP methyl ester carboxylesterase
MRPDSWIENQVTHHHFSRRDESGRDVRLHYVEAGEGPLVVLLHGFPEFWYSWRYQIPELASSGYRVVAPDMRGYSLSSKPRGVSAYRDELLTSDVAALIDEVGGGPAHVVGHDWGGLVAWLFAMRHPDKLSRLALCNMPHPLSYLRALRTWSQLKKSWYVLAFQIPWLPERLLLARDGKVLRQTLASNRGRLSPRARADLDLYVAAANQPGALTASMNYYRAAFRRNLMPWRWWRMERIDVPTLTVWGRRDAYLDISTATPPPELVPNHRLVVLPEASHWVQVHAPREVNAALLEHFGRPGSDRAASPSP